MSRLQEARRFNQAIFDIPAFTMRRANMADMLQLPSPLSTEAVCYGLIHSIHAQTP